MTRDYLYKDSSLKSKYPKGSIFGAGQYYFEHSSTNLNAWEVRPSEGLRYMNGWLSNASLR